METYLRFVNRYSKAILAVLLLITGFLGSQLAHLTADSNPYLLSEDHPARKTILAMQKEFTGTFDAALIALYNPNGVFNQPTLDAVYELTQQARRMILVDAADAEELAKFEQKYRAHQAVSGLARTILEGGFEQNDYFNAERLRELAQTLPLSQAEQSFLAFLPRRLNPIQELAGMAASENILTKDGVLVVRNSVEGTGADPATVRSEVMGNEMMPNGAVSKDAQVALIAVELFIKQEDAEGQLRAYRRLQEIVANYQSSHPELEDDIHIAGVPIFIAEQKKLIDHDMGTLFPVVVLLVGSILIVYFRKPLGFVLPMLNVVMCAVWTLGLMSLLGVPLDLITSVLPVFLVTICGADAIHMMSEYYGQRSAGLDNPEAVRRTMRAMVSPVVLTTLTTVAGFIVSTSTNISSIRTFGLFMAVGLVVAQIISLLLIPAWLNLMGSRKPASIASDSGRREILGSTLEKVLGFLIARRKASIAAFAVLLAAAALTATRINVEDAGADYFAKDNPFRVSDNFINEHVAGTSPGWISFEGNGPRSVLTTEAVDFLDRLDRFLLAQPNVTYTYSLPKYVKRMYLVLNDMDPAYNRLPRRVEQVASIDPMTGKRTVESVSGEDIISQSVLMYENGGGSELTNILNRDFSKTVTMFTMNTTRASEYKALLRRLNTWVEANKPAGLTVVVAGTPVIWSAVLDEIIQGQVLSFGLALATVAIVLCAWLGSFRLGVLAALPLAATIVFFYGLMTAFGIDLNIGTALISFLVVGIVDYSVHYLHRIRERLAAGDTLDGSLLYAIRHSGKSIVFNVIVFSCGFLALLFSDFTPIVHLGSLVALSLCISGVMSLFLISMLAPTFIRPSRKALRSPLPEYAGGSAS